MVKQFTVLACSAVVAFGLMACHTDDSGNGSAVPETKEIPVPAFNKTLKVNLSRALNSSENEKLTYTYTDKESGKLVTKIVNAGNTATFENVDNGTLNLTGDKLISKSATIDFGELSIVYVDWDLLAEKEGTEIEDKVYTETDPDVNAKDNLDESSASVSMKGTSVNNETRLKGMKLSITLYTPAVSPLTEIVEGDFEASPLAAKCKPVGYNFNPKVSFEASLPGAENCEIVGKNFGSDAECNWDATAAKFTAAMSSFSSTDPELSLKYNIKYIGESKKELASGALPSDDPITYKEYYGFECAKASGVIARLFRQLFGTVYDEKTTYIDRSFKFEGVDNATNYTVYQYVQEYEITSGTAKFNLKIYGKVTAEIVQVETPDVPSEDPEIVPTHNGGSND